MYLWKVAYNMEAFGVILCHYVEEEGVCVIVQCFVVQETLGKQTQILWITLKKQKQKTKPTY